MIWSEAVSPWRGARLPALLTVCAPLLLYPFSRGFTAGLLALAMVGLWALLRDRQSPGRDLAVRSAALIGLAYGLPVLASWPDAAEPERVLKIAALTPVYVLSAVGTLRLMSRYGLHHAVWMLLSLVLAFWVFDGWWQLLSGADLFGIPMSTAHGAPRVGAFFTHPAKFGYLIGAFAMLPLFALRLSGVALGWQLLAWLALFGMVLAGGSRAAWMVFALGSLVWLAAHLRQHNWAQRMRWLLLSALLAGTTLLALWQLSPGMRARLDQTFVDNSAETYQGVDRIISGRGDLWIAAGRSFLAHPVNGLGANNFRDVYREWLPEFGTWKDRDEEADHVHQFVLEIASGTGSIGLLGLGVIGWVLWRRWCAANPEQKASALPALMLLLMLWFPLGTHRNFYGSEMTMMNFWWLGLLLASLTQRIGHRETHALR